jgi:PST family polysaccharide transporter
MTAGSTPGDEAARDDVRAIDRRLVSGIAWTAVFRWVAQLISWVATLYVARILTPADYGLVAMAGVPIGFARLVEDLGLDAVIVQDRTLDEQQLANLGGTVLCLGGLLAAFFTALSTPIALYFHEPAVAVLVIALSLTMILDALQVVPRALLQRDLEFRTLAWLHGLYVTVAAVVMAGAATLHMGYWALVLNTLISGAAVTVALWVRRPYPLRWPRQLRSISRSLVSGWRMMVSRAAWYAYSSLDSAFIGRYVGKDALGVFGFAMTFASLPVTEVSTLVSKVIPGVFSSVQDSPATLRRYCLLITEAVSYLTLPMAVGLLLTADDFILLVLGARWEAVTLPLRILCLYMALNASQMAISHVLLWTGKFRANMWLNILAAILLPACFYVGVRWGVAGVSWAWAIGFPLSVLPSFILMTRIIDLKAAEYLEALRPAAVGCLVMAAIVLLTRQGLPDAWPHASRLAAQAGLGALVYAVVLLGFHRSRVTGIYQVVREARHA